MPAKKSKFDQILDNQKNIIKKLNKVIKEEKKEDLSDINEEKELLKLENIESRIEDKLKDKPLIKITSKDFFKSIIGAFFGILGHFSFFYGVEIAENISVMRASLLYILAFAIGAVFLYSAGFRKVESSRAVRLIPLRLIVTYFTSIAIIVVVLFVFGFINGESTFIEVFKSVATISILAVMGAITADLIGKQK